MSYDTLGYAFAAFTLLALLVLAFGFASGTDWKRVRWYLKGGAEPDAEPSGYTATFEGVITITDPQGKTHRLVVNLENLELDELAERR
jgi:hypothetical protein